MSDVEVTGGVTAEEEITAGTEGSDGDRRREDDV